MNDIQVMNKAADNIRILAASMVEKANSGHPGGAMGGADFVNVLFSEFLIYDPKNPKWEGRDRFFLDPGHMSPMLYSVLALSGKFTLDELQQFRQWGSVTPGHPEVELALMRMYRATGDKRYQELAAHFINARGVDSDYFKKESDNRGWTRLFTHIFPMEVSKRKSPKVPDVSPEL